MSMDRFIGCSLLLAGVLFGVVDAEIVYNEDFSSYATNMILSNGDSLGGGLLRWKRNTTTAWAVTNTIVSTSDQLKTELHPSSSGNSVYSFIAEATDIATLSGGQSTLRTVSLSMQTVPSSSSSSAGSLAVGFVKSGGVPALANWGVALGFVVQFGYVDGATKFIIRRRGTDGATDTWNGSAWTDDFTTGLSAYSLDKDYSIVSTQTGTNLTLEIYDGETLLESATTSFTNMFDFTDGMTWIAGDFNSQNAALPYEFTLNSVVSDDGVERVAVFSAVEWTGNEFQMTVTNMPAFSVNTLQFRNSLVTGDWENVSGVTTSGVSEAVFTVSSDDSAKFYRIVSE